MKQLAASAADDARYGMEARQGGDASLRLRSRQPARAFARGNARKPVWIYLEYELANLNERRSRISKAGKRHMPDTATVQWTAAVRRIEGELVSFDGRSSWYDVPADLMPVIREAQATRREVRITADRNCTVHAAELASAVAAKGLLDRLRGCLPRLFQTRQAKQQPR
jgi:hypothetical protein